MRRNLFSCSQSNVAILSRWPFERIRIQRPYPLPMPSHPSLIAALDPMRTTLTSAEHDGLRWETVAPWCR